jgi:hypothetical protein
MYEYVGLRNREGLSATDGLIVKPEYYTVPVVRHRTRRSGQSYCTPRIAAITKSLTHSIDDERYAHSTTALQSMRI